MLFPTFKNINWCYKNYFSFHFGFYAIFNITKIGNIEKWPFTYWLNGRWFLQIVDRDSGNLYIYIYQYVQYILYSLVLILYLKCGGGSGGMFFLHFMLLPTFLETKILGIKKYIYFRKTILFHLMFSLCFFPNIFRHFLGNIEKCPFTSG